MSQSHIDLKKRYILFIHLLAFKLVIHVLKITPSSIVWNECSKTLMKREIKMILLSSLSGKIKQEIRKGTWDMDISQEDREKSAQPPSYESDLGLILFSTMVDVYRV